MSRFLFTPELTKEDAQRIIDALNFQSRHKNYESEISKCVGYLENKELITKLRKLARISVE